MAMKISSRIAMFLTIMGPGIITAFADNDAGGIATYAAAGAKYGYGLLFTMFLHFQDFQNTLIRLISDSAF